MAALTASRNTPRWGDNLAIDLWTVGVKASAKIFPGSIVCIDASGFAVPATTALGLRAIGRCDNTLPVDNTGGANGDLTVLVRPGAFSWANSASADAVLATTPLGAPLYLVNDQTVAITDGNGTRSFAGVNAGLDTTSAAQPGVFVTCDYFLGTSAVGITDAIADPGTAAAIGVTRSGTVNIKTLSAGAETNTLAVPTFVGQVMTFNCDTHGANDREITVASAINVAGNTKIKVTAAGQNCTIKAVTIAGVLAWRVIANDGATLS